MDIIEKSRLYRKLHPSANEMVREACAFFLAEQRVATNIELENYLVEHGILGEQTSWLHRPGRVKGSWLGPVLALDKKRRFTNIGPGIWALSSNPMECEICPTCGGQGYLLKETT